jgi:hypothetical protein
LALSLLSTRGDKPFPAALPKPNKHRLQNGFINSGTRLVKEEARQRSSECIAKPSAEERVAMKTVTTKMIVSFAGLLLVAPFFAVALIVGARAVSLSQGTQDDLLLVALAVGGAVASIINGMGRRTHREKNPGSSRPVEATSNAGTRGTSMIHLGY